MSTTEYTKVSSQENFLLIQELELRYIKNKYVYICK
jgi:hypothetical protein